MVLVYILGQIKGNIMDNGKTIKCMGKECSHGKMEGCMMVSILMIRNKGMESLLGQMVGNMKDTG